MKPALELTSVPIWATTPTRPPADISGRYWSVIAFGEAGAEVARRWSTEIAGAGHESAMRIHEVDEDGDAQASEAAGVADDEMTRRIHRCGAASGAVRALPDGHRGGGRAGRGGCVRRLRPQSSCLLPCFAPAGCSPRLHGRCRGAGSVVSTLKLTARLHRLVLDDGRVGGVLVLDHPGRVAKPATMCTQPAAPTSWKPS